MKIDDMLVTPIAVIDPPLLNAAGLHAPYALRVIVELRLSNVVYGLGEVPGGGQIADALNAAAHADQPALERRFGHSNRSVRPSGAPARRPGEWRPPRPGSPGGPRKP